MTNRVLRIIKCKHDIEVYDNSTNIGASIIDTMAGGFPIGSGIVAVFNVVQSFSDYQFYKKLTKFLDPITDLSDEQKKSFLESIKNENDRISDYLCNLLLHCDEEELSHIMGLIYKEAVERNIDYNMMLRLCSIVNRSFIDDLKHLPEYVEEQQESSYITNSFTILGIMDIPETGAWQDHPSYQLNEIGSTLYEILAKNNWFERKI